VTPTSIVQTIPANGIRIPIVDESTIEDVDSLLNRLGIDAKAREESRVWLSTFANPVISDDTKFGQIRFLASRSGLAVLVLFVTVVSEETASRYPEYFDVQHFAPRADVVASCQLKSGELVDVVRLIGVDPELSLGRNLRVSVTRPRSGIVRRFTGETRTFGREEELTNEFVDWLSALEFNENVER
jgi:hypothetical protein